MKLDLQQTQQIVDMIGKTNEVSKQNLWKTLEKFMSEKYDIKINQLPVFMSAIETHLKDLKMEHGVKSKVASLFTRRALLDSDLKNSLNTEDLDKLIHSSVLHKVLALDAAMDLPTWQQEVGIMMIADEVASMVENQEDEFYQYFRDFVRPQEDIVETFKDACHVVGKDPASFIDENIIEALTKMNAKFDEATAGSNYHLSDLWDDSEKAVFHYGMQAVGHGVGIADDQDDVDLLASKGIDVKKIKGSFLSNPGYDAAYTFLVEYAKAKESEAEASVTVSKLTIYYIWRKEEGEWVRGGLMTVTNDADLKKFKEDAAVKAKRRGWEDYKVLPEGETPVEASILSKVLADAKLDELNQARENNPYKDKKHIAVTYRLITPESAEQGDVEDHGYEDFIDCTPDQYDIEEGLTAVDLAVKEIKNAGGSQPSSSQFHKGIWYTDPDSTSDLQSGDVTSYDYHPQNFTEEEEKQIWEKIMNKTSEASILSKVLAASENHVEYKGYKIHLLDTGDGFLPTVREPAANKEIVDYSKPFASREEAFSDAKKEVDMHKKEYGAEASVTASFKPREVSDVLLALNSSAGMGKYPIGNKELTEKVKKMEEAGLISYDKGYDKWSKGKGKKTESSILARVLAGAKNKGILEIDPQTKTLFIKPESGNFAGKKVYLEKHAQEYLKEYVGKRLEFELNDNDEAVNLISEASVTSSLSLEDIAEEIMKHEADFLNEEGFLDGAYIRERFNLDKASYSKVVRLVEQIEQTKGSILSSILAELDFPVLATVLACECQENKTETNAIGPDGLTTAESDKLQGVVRFKHEIPMVDAKGKWYAFKDEEFDKGLELQGKQIKFHINENDEVTDTEIVEGSTKVMASSFTMTPGDKESQKAALVEFLTWMQEGRIENDANDPDYDPDMIGEDVEDQLTGVSGEINGQRNDDLYKAITQGMSPEEIKAIALEVGIDRISPDGWAYYEGSAYKSAVQEILDSRATEATTVEALEFASPEEQNSEVLRVVQNCINELGRVNGTSFVDALKKAREEFKGKTHSSEDEENEEITPDEEDIFIQSTGPLGSKTQVTQGGKVIWEGTEMEEAEAAIKAWMNKSKFFPSVWQVSDHGNVHPYSMEE